MTMRCAFRSAALLAGTVFVLCGQIHSQSLAVEDAGERLKVENCSFEDFRGEAQCGTLEVYENRRTRQGRRIPIYFVRLRATGSDPQPDPIFFLSGGPGGEAATDISGKVRAYRHLLAKRDLVIVDQRGTGRSAPLDCRFIDLEDDPAAFAGLFEADFFSPRAFADCLKQLRKRADLTQYTTSAIADDIEELRQALGYRKVNLDGGSYGTRLGLEYLRRHPHSVRSAVLRGVAPSFEFLLERVARDFDETLEALFAACQAEGGCSKTFPRFKERLRSLFERLRREPVTVELENPATGEAEKVTINYGKFATALRFALYSTSLSARLPMQVEAAHQGDFRPLVQDLSKILVQLVNAISEGLWASVICSEEVPFIDVAKARRQSQGTILGAARLDATLAICKGWPKGQIPADFHEPVQSDLPVLLIAGEYDPASPLELAE
ncbi:MAG TPA: alpha/beta fold hydrolase, partial [Acidobacteriota bacterium]|nr:alpha/beta fold hydrolase [Acidobacteriota bacterium]